MLRKLGALSLAGMMAYSTVAAAAEGSNQGALAPGKPATVKKAQNFADGHYLLWVAGVGFVLVGIGLVAQGDSHGSVTITTPCSPSGTCPPTTTTTTTTTTTPTTTTSTTSN